MVNINWDEFKIFKQYSHKDDNFLILLDFIKSYYNMNNPMDIYETLSYDGTGQMMLDKRQIKDVEDLENFMFQI